MYSRIRRCQCWCCAKNQGSNRCQSDLRLGSSASSVPLMVVAPAKRRRASTSCACATLRACSLPCMTARRQFRVRAMRSWSVNWSGCVIPGLSVTYSLQIGNFRTAQRKKRAMGISVDAFVNYATRATTKRTERGKRGLLVRRRQNLAQRSSNQPCANRPRRPRSLLPELPSPETFSGSLLRIVMRLPVAS